MQAPDRLRTLATIIENVAAGTIDVTDVHTPNQSLIDDQSVTVQVSAQIQFESLTDLGDEVTVSVPDDATITTFSDAGGLELPLAITIDTPDPSSSPEPASNAESHVTDGGVAVSAAAATTPADTSPDPADEAAQAAASDAAPNTTARDESDTDAVAPHRDPNRLQAVYEQHETFPEMTDALDVDVTAQTVRHHMIKHGIHQPTEQATSDLTAATADDSAAPASDGSAADATLDNGVAATESAGNDDGTDTTKATTATASAAEERDKAATDTADDGSPAPVTEADLPAEIDLPTHLTVSDIVAAVAEAQTLYEVQRALRIDRGQARQLLRDLNVLEFVSGCVSTAADQQSGEDEIIERIRQGCA